MTACTILVGVLVGFAALLNYTSNISTVGTYFVHPDYRGHGVGPQLFDKLIEDSVREGRNIGLNASKTFLHVMKCK